MTIEPALEQNDRLIDEFGRYLLCVIVQKLDTALVDSKVTELQRRKICSVFTDSLASFLDYGWLASEDDETLWPLVAFAERKESDHGVEVPLRVIVPTKESYLGEGGAEGAIALRFEQNPEIQEWLAFRSGLRGESP